MAKERQQEEARETTILIPIEVTANTTGDAKVLAECLWAILTEGLQQYAAYGDLADYRRIDLFLSPDIILEGPMLEDRAKRENRLRGFWRHCRLERKEEDPPATQSTLPGL